jgi:hypothetical protein
VKTIGLPSLPSACCGVNEYVKVREANDTLSPGVSLLPDCWTEVTNAVVSVIV